jgi:hypothetical protein
VINLHLHCTYRTMQCPMLLIGTRAETLPLAARAFLPLAVAVANRQNSILTERCSCSLRSYRRALAKRYWVILGTHCISTFRTSVIETFKIMLCQVVTSPMAGTLSLGVSQRTYKSTRALSGPLMRRQKVFGEKLRPAPPSAGFLGGVQFWSFSGQPTQASSCDR